MAMSMPGAPGLGDDTEVPPIPIQPPSVGDAFDLVGKSLTPLQDAFYTAQAAGASNAITADQFRDQAKNGVAPLNYAQNTLDELHQRKLENEAASMKLKQQEADYSRLNFLEDEYTGMIGNAPIQPTMGDGKLNQEQQLALAIGGLLGGGFDGAAQVMGYGEQIGKQNAQEQYTKDVQQYERDLGIYNTGLKSKAGQINSEMRFVETQNRSYEKAYINQMKRYADISKGLDADIDAEMKGIVGTMGQFTKNAQTLFRDKGEWGKEDEQAFVEGVSKWATAKGLNPQAVLDELRPGIPQIGDKTVAKVNSENVQSRGANKLEEAEFQNRLKGASGTFKTWLTELSKRPKITDDDIKDIKAWIKQLPDELEPYFFAPSAGETTQAYVARIRNAETARHNKVTEGQGDRRLDQGDTANDIRQQNADTSAANTESLIQQRRTVPIGKNGVDPKMVTQVGESFKKAFPGGRFEQYGPGSVAGSQHPAGKGLDLYVPKGKNLDDAVKWAMQQGAGYIVANNKQYRLNPKTGHYSEAKYRGPHDHKDHVHIDWHNLKGGMGKGQPQTSKPNTASKPDGKGFGIQNEGGRSSKPLTGSDGRVVKERTKK